MSSVMLRGWFAIARHDECDAITGAVVTAERVVERLVGDVRDVDHHAEPVQLADDVLAERRQAVVRRLVGRRVGPVVVLEVRQRQVADAERGVVAQQPQIVVDHVAAFHAHQRGDLVLGRRAADVGGGRRQHQIVRVRRDRLRAPRRSESIARFTAGGPVTSLGTQIEKNSASSPPSRIRGTSMLPSLLRARCRTSCRRSAAASCRRASR